MSTCNKVSIIPTDGVTDSTDKLGSAPQGSTVPVVPVGGVEGVGVVVPVGSGEVAVEPVGSVVEDGGEPFESDGSPSDPQPHRASATALHAYRIAPPPTPSSREATVADVNLL
jgi:hypothetical protein